jgi:uncharacterized protein YbjT (DUF2867 family)
MGANGQVAGTGPIKSLYHAEALLENWGMVLPVAQKDGLLPSFIAAARKTPTVATADIGRAVAQALLDGPRGRRVIELSGPTDPTPNDVAAACSRLFDRQVGVQEAPIAAVVPTFTSFGLSPGMAALYQEMYQGIADGKVAWEGGAAEAKRGTVDVDTGLGGLAG